MPANSCRNSLHRASSRGTDARAVDEPEDDKACEGRDENRRQMSGRKRPEAFAGRLGRDGVQPPLAGNALELVRAMVVESDPRTDHRLLHGLRDEDLIRPCERANPRADVNGNSAKVIAEDLELSGVNAGPHP